MRRYYWAIDGPGSILYNAYFGNDAGKQHVYQSAILSKFFKIDGYRMNFLNGTWRV